MTILEKDIWLVLSWVPKQAGTTYAATNLAINDDAANDDKEEVWRRLPWMRRWKRTFCEWINELRN